MSDEVIVGLLGNSGSAFALPLYSFRHMYYGAMTEIPVASSFETRRRRRSSG
jgi:hypothetical protein